MYEHYISEFVLRHFSEDKVRIWICENEGDPQQRKIKKVFGGHNITSLKTIDTSNRASKSMNPKTFEQSVRKDTEVYEKDVIGKLESDAAPIIQRIVDDAPKNRLPSLSPEEITVVKRFLVLSTRRTPESQDRIKSQNDPDFAFDLMKRMVDKENIPFGDKEEMYHQVPPIKRMNDMVLENTDARFAAGVIPTVELETEEFCRKIGIAVAYSGSTRSRFIIGSYGYAIVTRNLGTGYDRVAYFPVSPNVAISVTSRPDRAYVYPVEANEVRQTNISIAELSHAIAGSTKDGLLTYQRYVKIQ